MKDFAARFDDIVIEMKRIMLEKRRLRGTENISRQGLPGIVLRISEDKLSRIKRQINDVELNQKMREHGIPTDLVNKYVKVDETSLAGLEDDFLDVANYCVIAIMLLQKNWFVPEVDEEKSSLSAIPEHQVRAILP